MKRPALTRAAKNTRMGKAQAEHGPDKASRRQGPTADGRVRPLLLALALLGTLLAGTGCNRTAGEGSGNGQPDKLTVMLDWYPNAVHSFLYAAEAEGYFAEQGLEVKLQMPAETNDALKLAAAGKVDLALTYQPQVLMARGESVPVKSVAAVVRHPLNRLLLPANGPVTRPKELQGRTAGYSSIPLYEAMLRTMVEADGGDPSRLKLVDVGYDLIPALATGRTDAIIGGFVNHEELLLKKAGHPVVSINPADYGVPDYYELVFAASDDTIAERGDAIRRFLKAAAEGQAYVSEHPQEALDLVLKHEDAASPLDPEIERTSLGILLPLMDAGNKPFGYQEPASWERVAEWLKSHNLLQKDISPKDAYVGEDLVSP